jgi:hypothetical protein
MLASLQGNVDQPPSTPLLNPVTQQPFSTFQKLNFEDYESIYSTSSTADLLRGYLIFRMCNIPGFVKHADHLLYLSQKVLGKKITTEIVRQSFFRHFCAGAVVMLLGLLQTWPHQSQCIGAGEDADGIMPTIRRLHESRVGAILDYAAEDDVHDEQGRSARGSNQGT